MTEEIKKTASCKTISDPNLVFIISNKELDYVTDLFYIDGYAFSSSKIKFPKDHPFQDEIDELETEPDKLCEGIGILHDYEKYYLVYERNLVNLSRPDRKDNEKVLVYQRKLIEVWNSLFAPELRKIPSLHTYHGTFHNQFKAAGACRVELNTTLLNLFKTTYPLMTLKCVGDTEAIRLMDLDRKDIGKYISVARKINYCI